MFGFKKPNYSAQTIGTITGLSAIKVNMLQLPLAEYEVDGKIYKVRVPYDIASPMELKAKQEAGYENTIKDTMRAMKDAVVNVDSDAKLVRANLNVGTDLEGQLTFTQGKKVIIMYDPDRPKKAKVVGEYIENNSDIRG